jgi:hypothetical protein
MEAVRVWKRSREGLPNTYIFTLLDCRHRFGFWSGPWSPAPTDSGRPHQPLRIRGLNRWSRSMTEF